MADSQPIIIPVSELLPDRSGPVPLYFQVATGLEQAILSNSLPPGSRLENELSLSDRLGLSRPTVRRAIQELVEKGLLVRRRGIGTQVVHGAVSRRIVDLVASLLALRPPIGDRRWASGLPENA